MTEPLTPVQIESKLRRLISQITQGQQHLALCRDLETEEELAYKKAKLVAAHHPDCPVVTRGAVTLSERESWIDSATWDEYASYKRSTTAREIAQDALRAVLAVADTAQSLNASVRQAYSMAGHG